MRGFTLLLSALLMSQAANAVTIVSLPSDLVQLQAILNQLRLPIQNRMRDIKIATRHLENTFRVIELKGTLGSTGKPFSLYASYPKPTQHSSATLITTTQDIELNYNSKSIFNEVIETVGTSTVMTDFESEIFFENNPNYLPGPTDTHKTATITAHQQQLFKIDSFVNQSAKYVDRKTWKGTSVTTEFSVGTQVLFTYEDFNADDGSLRRIYIQRLAGTFELAPYGRENAPGRSRSTFSGTASFEIIRKINPNKSLPDDTFKVNEVEIETLYDFIQNFDSRFYSPIFKNNYFEFTDQLVRGTFPDTIKIERPVRATLMQKQLEEIQAWISPGGNQSTVQNAYARLNEILELVKKGTSIRIEDDRPIN